MRMSKFLHYSSISKKVFMGLAGLFLALFLCVHLVINLLLLAGDEGKMFTDAADFMGSNIFIKIFEVILFGGFLLHMLIGLIVTFKNWASRPVRYHRSNRSETSFLSKYMFHTGIIIMIFLILHFMNFFFIKLGWVEAPAGIDSHDFYPMAILLFQNIWYSLAYLVFFVFLGFHLNHSIQSAFQTLGFNHNRYNTCIKVTSAVYSIIISAGFAVIPIYFLFFYQQ
jgi:succinate dehydrogenase / fumarate reductase cytochrome b subunit